MEYELNQLEFKIVNDNTAKSFITKYHYSHSCGGVVIALGAYYNNELKNCIVFNYCCGREMAKQVLKGGSNENVLELSRMVSLEPKPKNLESYCISHALRWLKHNMPNVQCIISYADNTMGHKGYCYQASGFKYYGQSRPTKEWYLDGERIHERVLNSRYGTSSYEQLQPILGNRLTYKLNTETKSRYFFILSHSKKEKRELDNLIQVECLPFPKGDNRRYDMNSNGNFKSLKNGNKKNTRVFNEQLSLF